MAQVRIAVIGAGLIGRTAYRGASLGQSRLHARGGRRSLAGCRRRRAVSSAIRSTPRSTRCSSAPSRTAPSWRCRTRCTCKVGLACIARKIPIIVEKPVADSVAEALELVEAGERANVAILTGHHRRHNPIMRKAAEIIAGGGIGRVVAANGLWLSHKPKDYFNVTWRREAGGGPILINAIHDIDCLRMLCGDVESVSAGRVDARRAISRSRTRPRRCCTSRAARSGRCWCPMRSRRRGRGSGARARTRNRPHDTENCYIVAGTQGLDHGAVAAAPLARAGPGELGQSADRRCGSR